MSQQLINIGSQNNDGNGDSLRDAFAKINANFGEVYSLAGYGNGIFFTQLDDAPNTVNDGSLIVGSSGNILTQKTLTAGSGISIVQTPTDITIDATVITSLVTDPTPTLGTNLTGAGFRGVNFSDPVDLTDLATKQYVDVVAAGGGATLRTDLNGYLVGSPFNSTTNQTWGVNVGNPQLASINKVVARDGVGDIYFNVGHGVATTATVGNTLAVVDAAATNGAVAANANKVVVRNGAGDIFFNVGHGTVSVAGVGNTLAVSDAPATNGSVAANASTAVIRNSAGDIFFNVGHGTATSALFADLAERYKADAEYEPGTVVIFGGEFEITKSVSMQDNRVAGVISTAPAYLMNDVAGAGLPVALQGRVPCKVIGIIKKGNMLVTSHIAGVAMSASRPAIGTVIGKALQDYSSDQIGIIEVVVGRV